MRLNESVGIDGLSKFQQNLMYKNPDEYVFVAFVTDKGETTVYRFVSLADGTHIAYKKTGHDSKSEMSAEDIIQARHVLHVSQLDSQTWLPKDLIEDLKVFMQVTVDSNMPKKHYDYRF